MITKLLTVDPVERVTAGAALQHPVRGDWCLYDVEQKKTHASLFPSCEKKSHHCCFGLRTVNDHTQPSVAEETE